MPISGVLEAAILSSSAEERQRAEQRMRDLAQENWVEYLGELVGVLGSESERTEVRMLAGLAAKNELTSKDAQRRAQQSAQWIEIAQDAKNQMKSASVAALMTEDERVANQAAQLVAAIAAIELPRGEWPELMRVIVDNTKSDRPVHVKRASLLTIGYICEECDPDNAQVAAQSNGILIAIVQGAQPSEPSVVVRRTALEALVNSLEFIAGNFAREGERNYIMQVVCEATTAQDAGLQAVAFGALARIMSLYYQYMGVYMEKALYGLTVNGMRSGDDRVACMAVEFWSTVCEEELEIQLSAGASAGGAGANGADQSAGAAAPTMYNFALVAIPDVLPTLLSLLTRQNDDPDDDSWSVAMAAGACLQLFAQDTGNYVVRPTLQFVEQNISAAGWRQKEAAVMAFGSILDGPDRDQLKVVVQQALPALLALIHDESRAVCETASWCIGRISDLVVSAIEGDESLHQVMDALTFGLQSSPKVVANCCWALINLLEQLCADAASAQSSALSPYYPTLVPALLQVSAHDDNAAGARTSAYEALSSAVLYCGQGDINFVQQIATEAMQRLEQTLADSAKASVGNKADLEELQSNLLSLLTSVTRRIGSDAAGVSDQLMRTYIKMLDTQGPDSVTEEDVFMAVSAVAAAVDSAFVKYMPPFLPFLTKALENVDSPVCDAAIGIVVDICHSLGEDFIPYCQGFMAILGNTLANPRVRRELRPLILSCFGDIASSIAGQFVQYLQVVMEICKSAQEMQPQAQAQAAQAAQGGSGAGADGASAASASAPAPVDYSETEYLVSVREAVLDAYVGIVAGLHDSPQSLAPYMTQIAGFLMAAYSDPQLAANESVCRSAVGMIGDLAQMYPDGSLRDFFSQQWVTDFIRRTRANQGFSKLTRDTARWAREQQKAQLRG